MNQGQETYQLKVLSVIDQPGPKVYQVGPVGSVLNVAWAEAENGTLEPFSSILAVSQTQGRGRQGRVWESPPGHVYAAIRLPLAPPFTGTLASVAFGLAIIEAFEDLGFMGLTLKWPNDLLINRGKGGGILLENRHNILIAGVGLNIGTSPFPEHLRQPGTVPPSAFPQSWGPADQLWLKLAKKLYLRYNSFFPEREPDWARNICTLAEKKLAGLGQMVTILKPASDPKTSEPVLTGLLLGLAPSGALRVEGPDGERTIWSGTLLLPNFFDKIVP
jgi:BirA family biotin operon repressor/biotin-[acetyl-CoA-carboxylase] ligase